MQGLCLAVVVMGVVVAVVVDAGGARTVGLLQRCLERCCVLVVAVLSEQKQMGTVVKGVHHHHLQQT